jgi:hypothetical protein
MEQDHESVSKAEPRLGKPRQSIEVPLAERQAYSPAEFAALFGRRQTWGYRQLYAGRVKAIRNLGRLLIPRSEVERLLKELTLHEGTRVSPVTGGRSK